MIVNVVNFPVFFVIFYSVVSSCCDWVCHFAGSAQNENYTSCVWRGNVEIWGKQHWYINVFDLYSPDGLCICHCRGWNAVSSLILSGKLLELLCAVMMHNHTASLHPTGHLWHVLLVWRKASIKTSAVNRINFFNCVIHFFNCTLIAVLMHILFVTFSNLSVFHLQVDVVGPLLLNASPLLVVTTDSVTD